MPTFSPGATGQSVELFVMDDIGKAVDGLDAATFPAIYWSAATGGRNAITLVDLVSANSGWTEGGVFGIGGGLYRFDPPNAVFVDEGVKTIGGEETNKRTLYRLDVRDEEVETSELVNALAGQTLQVNSPIAQDGSIEIIRGNDYLGAEALVFMIANYAGTSMSGGTASMAIMLASEYESSATATPVVTVSGTVTQSGATVTITIPLTAAQTAALSPAPPTEKYSHTYEVRVVTSAGNGSKKITPWLGSINVRRGAFA